jgi:hypothetical protein
LTPFGKSNDIFPLAVGRAIILAPLSTSASSSAAQDIFSLVTASSIAGNNSFSDFCLSS